MNKKTVWITGASSGIGQEFARQYARLGFRLILTARRKDRLDTLAEELQARSEEMRARTRSSKYFGKGRMLRAYPKLRHGEKHRSLDELRERLKYERRH